MVLRVPVDPTKRGPTPTHEPDQPEPFPTNGAPIRLRNFRRSLRLNLRRIHCRRRRSNPRPRREILDRRHLRR